VDHLIFPDHAWKAMAADSITDEDVYHVIGDWDDMIEHVDGRTEYIGTIADGRHITVVLESDDQTVVTAWWNKRRSRRR
jgi:hypothetical protein